MDLAWVAVLVSFGIAALVVVVLLGAGALLRPRRPSAVKAEAFECGNPATGPAWGRVSVKFYLTAILFIVFDVEVVFLYPWAVAFRRLGFFGFVEMATAEEAEAAIKKFNGQELDGRRVNVELAKPAGLGGGARSGDGSLDAQSASLLSCAHCSIGQIQACRLASGHSRALLR